MKELVSAVFQETANRLKAPILGSFVLSWLIINYSFILTFVFSTSARKIEILNSHPTFWCVEPTIFTCPAAMTILYPILAALIYTFVLPFIQYKIDKNRFRLIDCNRIREKHRSQRFAYLSQLRISRAKAKSSQNYWQEKLNRDLDKWDEKRAILKNEIKQLRETNNSLHTQINSLTSEKTDLNKTIGTLNKKIQENILNFSNKEIQLKDEFDDLRNENYKEQLTLNKKISKLENIIEKLNRELNKVDEQRSIQKEEIKQVQEENNSLYTQINSLSSEKTNLNEIINNFTDKEIQLRNKIDVLHNEQLDSNKKISDLEKILNKSKRELKYSYQHSSKLQSHIERSNAKFNTTQSSLNNILVAYRKLEHYIEEDMHVELLNSIEKQYPGDEHTIRKIINILKNSLMDLKHTVKTERKKHANASSLNL